MRHLHTLSCIIDVATTGSIRKSAERLHLTPSALTRRIQDFEQELGTPLFDRTSHGMRLNAAGELFTHHARGQVAELDRVRAQIADLSGLRRGHIALVCSQVFVDHVIPNQVAAFRSRYPKVSFQVQVRDHASAVAALAAHEAELALILQPPPLPELEILSVSHQPICAIMAATHPLAAGTAPVRLRDCLRLPVAMPDHSLSIRHSLDAAIVRAGLAVTTAVESGSIELLRNYVLREPVISFQVSIGISAERRGLAVRGIDPRDLPPLQVVLGHLRGRKLSTAAAGFADQLTQGLQR